MYRYIAHEATPIDTIPANSDHMFYYNAHTFITGSYVSTCLLIYTQILDAGTDHPTNTIYAIYFTPNCIL
jgi:hypothetical protein